MTPSSRVVSAAGGALYVAIIALGVCEEFFIRGRLIVAGDAVATAKNLEAMQPLWRAGVASELVLLICAVALTAIFFVLLRPVSRGLALMMVFFNLVSIAVEGVAALFLAVALFPLGDAAYLKAFDSGQLAAMTSMSIRAHGYGFSVALIFFGCECLLLGYLIFKSGYLPKTIGILMAAAGLSYLTHSFTLIAVPRLASVLFPAIFFPAFVGESSFAMWLLLKGVK